MSSDFGNRIDYDRADWASSIAEMMLSRARRIETDQIGSDVVLSNLSSDVYDIAAKKIQNPGRRRLVFTSELEALLPGARRPAIKRSVQQLKNAGYFLPVKYRAKDGCDYEGYRINRRHADTDLVTSQARRIRGLLSKHPGGLTESQLLVEVSRDGQLAAIDRMILSGQAEELQEHDKECSFIRLTVLPEQD